MPPLPKLLCRNPLLIGSMVLTFHHWRNGIDLPLSQSPPNRVNGSHGKNNLPIGTILQMSQSPPNRVNGSHVST